MTKSDMNTMEAKTRICLYRSDWDSNEKHLAIDQLDVMKLNLPPQGDSEADVLSVASRSRGADTRKVS